MVLIPARGAGHVVIGPHALRAFLCEPSMADSLGKKLDSQKADVDRLPSGAVHPLREISTTK